MATPILNLAKQDATTRARTGRRQALQGLPPLSQRLGPLGAPPPQEGPPPQPQAGGPPPPAPLPLPSTQPQSLPSPSPAQPLPTSKTSWFDQLSQLKKSQNKLDEPAAAKLADLSKRTEYARTAFEGGKLREGEYENVVASIQGVAKTYPWKSHIKPPGSNPGDVIVEDGIEKVRTKEGLTAIGYTPEYISKNITMVGDSGNIAVPVAPGKPAKIINRRDWERNASDERQGINETHKLIQERFKLVQELRKPGKALTDGMGNIVGHSPFTPAELNDMSIEAAEIVSKQYLQARAVYKNIIDGAGRVEENNSVVPGETFDPFVKEKEIAELEAKRDQLQAAISRQGGGAPTPTPSPTPPPFGTTLDEDVWGDVGGGSVRATPEERAVSSLKYTAAKARQKSLAYTGAGLLAQIASANSEAVIPLKAATKVEMNKKFGDNKKYPEGTTVQLSDGRKYTKEEGEFWQLPPKGGITEKSELFFPTDPTRARERLGGPMGVDAMYRPLQENQQAGPAEVEPPPSVPNEALRPVAGQEASPQLPPPEPGELKPIPVENPPKWWLQQQQQQQQVVTPQLQPPQQPPSQPLSKPDLSAFPKLQRAAMKATLRLRQGQRPPASLKVGEAFLDSDGLVWIKQAGDRYLGPYTPQDINLAP